MSKETAFYPRLQALTDQWMDLFGYLAPLVVTDGLEEYRAVRESAGLMDFTMLRKVDIDGPGALELVNTVVTRDVSKLTPGKIAYGALADEDGKMVDDCTVMREMLQSLTDEDLSNEVFLYYTFREDVEVAGVPIFMTRMGYTAELGYELWVERERALELSTCRTRAQPGP